MAYILGYFAADGSMIQNSRGGCYVEFTSTDRCLLASLKRVASAPQRISKRVRVSNAHKKQYRIQVGSKRWFNDLSLLGFTSAKSKILEFPSVPVRLLAHFVRGYFDGDGCVYFKTLHFADRKRPRPVLLSIFTSGSLPFLKSLWSALKENGVVGGSLLEKSHGFELKFSHRDSVALFDFIYHTGPTTELYLPRKRKLFEKAIRTLYKNAVVA